MFNSIIRPIFDMYLDNEFKGIRPLFQDDWQKEYEELAKFERKHQFLPADCTYLECDLINPIVYKGEMKGFTNGIKLAARLFLEICDKPQIAEKKIFTKNNEKATDKMNTDDEDILCKVERLAATIVCTRSYFDEFDENGEHHSIVYSMLRQAEDMADEIYHILIT